MVIYKGDDLFNAVVVSLGLLGVVFKSLRVLQFEGGDNNDHTGTVDLPV